MNNLVVSSIHQVMSLKDTNHVLNAIYVSGNSLSELTIPLMHSFEKLEIFSSALKIGIKMESFSLANF